VADDPGELRYGYRRDDLQWFGARTHDTAHIRDAGFGDALCYTDNQWQRDGKHFFAALDFPVNGGLVALDFHALSGRHGGDTQQFTDICRDLRTVIIDGFTTGKDEVKRMVFGVGRNLVRHKPRIAGCRIDTDSLVSTDGQCFPDGGFGSSLANVDDGDLAIAAIGQIDRSG